MKVHHGEGVVTHTGPEPCVGIREGAGEASVGERIGQPLSRKSYLSWSADAVVSAEGNADGRVIPPMGDGIHRKGVKGTRADGGRYAHPISLQVR